MIGKNNTTNTFYVIAPFNSRMILDNLSLIGKYEDFRKKMYKKLNLTYPNQVLIENIGNATVQFEAIQNWLGEIKTSTIKEEDALLFKGTGGSGVTQKDKSIITMIINQEFDLPVDIIGSDIFATSPKLVLESMSFHEYGVGTIYCKLEINFRQELLNSSKGGPKKILADLLDKVVTYPNLLKATKSIGNDVYQSYLRITEELSIKKSIVSYEDLFGEQKSSIPLWGHIVIVREDLDDNRKEEIEALIDNVVDVSHPDGAVDFAKGTKGYVHMGWGNSLWTGLNETELNYAKEVLRYIEVEWRTLQVFNNIMYERLNQFASYEKLQKKAIKMTMDWIDILRMETELYSLDKSNYLQNLAPFAHFVYNESVESWRISQMSEFFEEKLEVFEYLHQQGKDTLNDISDSRINNILFIFTCLSLVSTFLDGLMFVSAENIAELFGYRLFLLIFPPVAFIVIILMFFARFGSSKTKRKKA